MATAVGVKIDFDTGDFNVFPSVSRGAVSIDRAKSVLGFKPHSWDDIFAVSNIRVHNRVMHQGKVMISDHVSLMLQETVPFYKEAFYKFSSERDDVVHTLTRNIIPRHRKGDFLKMIDDLADDPTKSVDEYRKY